MDLDHVQYVGGKIRRAVDPPWTQEEAKRRKANCRHRLTIATNSPVKITSIYSRSRSWRMSYDRECTIKQRDISGWIDIDNCAIGKFDFVEFDIGPLVYNDEFRQVLDNNSRVEAEMADALLSCWDDIGDELGAYGTILDFRRVWMHPDHAKDGLWATIARQIIDKEFNRRALLTMKAFPLEYEGCSTSQNRAMRAKRQRAMIRHYSKLLDVHPLPGRAGEEGWLFRIPERLEGIVTPPAVQNGREFPEQ